MADAIIARARKSRSRRVESPVRRKIFALSVCGLLHMSTRNFPAARAHLDEATQLARDFGLKSELATQHNNLGRVYLEFGRLDEAVHTFREARRIDDGLGDRFGLAYDLRNLGTALALRGAHAEAQATLERALTLAREVRDTNNELRALFELAELARTRGQTVEAERAYHRALPLARTLDVKELAWQIHRALGLMRRAEGDFEAAETAFRRAIQVARSMTGRAAPSNFGVHRYAAIDDLMLLFIEQGRVQEAFALAELHRSLTQTQLLEDRRIHFDAPAVPELLRRARAARTATAALAARAALEPLEPRLAELLHQAVAADVSSTVPDDAAVVVYRPTSAGLVTFVLDAAGISAEVVPMTVQELRHLVRVYGQRLVDRADMTKASAGLASALLRPIVGRISSKKRLAFVLADVLRYVAFPALPYAGEQLLIDRFVLVQALDPRSAARTLLRPAPPLGNRKIVALAGAVSGRSAPLDFAQKELQAIVEEYPSSEVYPRAEGGRRAFLDALARADSVVHFAGHAKLDAADPLAGSLITDGQPVALYEILGRDAKAALVVLSACESRVGAGLGEDLLSLAESFWIAGAGAVLATSTRIHDLAAAVLMKRFYRSVRLKGPAEALRDAQQVVRRYHPHPAWWATFSLLGG